jgi:hypothetical protein
MQYPHCDSRILHAPGECEFCDLHPKWQELRGGWGVAFTGHAPQGDEMACPADRARPAGSEGDHRQWVATRQLEVGFANRITRPVTRPETFSARIRRRLGI